MKRAFLGVLAAIVVLSMSTATAFAAQPGCGRYFVDANGDGICDHAGRGCVYTDQDGDGICDICGANHRGRPAGRGAGFVDADGDGICDNYVPGQGGCGRGFQTGRGAGSRGGYHR